MRYFPNAPALRPACEPKIQVPAGTDTVYAPGNPRPMKPAEFARFIAPVPFYVGPDRIQPANTK